MGGAAAWFGAGGVGGLGVNQRLIPSMGGGGGEALAGRRVKAQPAAGMSVGTGCWGGVGCLLCGLCYGWSLAGCAIVSAVGCRRTKPLGCLARAAGCGVDVSRRSRWVAGNSMDGMAAPLCSEGVGG